MPKFLNVPGSRGSLSLRRLSSISDCFDFLGRGGGDGGKVVKVLTFYSDNPILNPAGY